eukprot:959608_1
MFRISMSLWRVHTPETFGSGQLPPNQIDKEGVDSDRESEATPIPEIAEEIIPHKHPLRLVESTKNHLSSADSTVNHMDSTVNHSDSTVNHSDYVVNNAGEECPRSIVPVPMCSSELPSEMTSGTRSFEVHTIQQELPGTSATKDKEFPTEQATQERSKRKHSKSRSKTSLGPPSIPFRNISNRFSHRSSTVNPEKVAATIEKQKRVDSQMLPELSTANDQPRLNSSRWLQQHIEYLESQPVDIPKLAESNKSVKDSRTKVKQRVASKILSHSTDDREYSGLVPVDVDPTDVLAVQAVYSGALPKQVDRRWERKLQLKPDIRDFFQDTVNHQVRSRGVSRWKIVH